MTTRAPGSAIVDAIAWIVPADRRDEWAAEWRAELAARWSAGDASRLGLIARACASMTDALWIRKRHGSQSMLAQHVRLALRGIVRRPAFSAIVVATLALGIGANAAIFSVVNAVLLRALPYPEPDRLVRVVGYPRDGDTTSRSVGRGSSFADYADIRDNTTTFAHLAAYSGFSPAVIIEGQEPFRPNASYATWNLFPALGVAPEIGATWTAADDAYGARNVVVISHGLWSSRFGVRRDVIGTPITIDGRSHTIIGVLPAGIGVPTSATLWIPYSTFPRIAVRGVHSSGMIGRVKTGVDVARAQRDAEVVALRLEHDYPQSNRNRSARLEPLREALVVNSRPALRMLSGAVIMVLLIVCANLASLFTSRAASREREAAVRTALGASRGQLASQLLTESVILALVGGALGLLIAKWGAAALVAKSPTPFPGVAASSVGLDPVVLTFVALVSVVAGLASGLIPALHFSRARVLSALRDAGRGSAGGVRSRVRRALVVVEIALAVVLVIGAGLLIKSFSRLQRVDVGFDPKNLLAVTVQLPETHYGEPEKRWEFFRRAVEQVKAIPGVVTAGASFEHPTSEGFTSSFTIGEHPAPKPGSEPEARVRPVMAGYFKMVGIPLKRGRDIEPTDVAGSQAVVVVNDAFVREHFGNEDPIGKTVNRGPWWPGMAAHFTIIGVVADEKFMGLTAPAEPATYFALPQFAMAGYILVKTQGDPLALTDAIRRAIWSADRTLPLDNVVTLESTLEAQLAPARFNASMLAIFGAVALVLAALGIYGVISYSVTQRTGEIGIRVALGASSSKVMRMVVGNGMTLAATGIALGLVGAVFVTRGLTRLLFGVESLDPLVYVVVAIIIAGVAFVAGWLPARRAASISPLEALRGD